MGLVRKLVGVRHGDVSSVLSCSDEGCMLEGEFMGLKTTVEKTRKEAQKDVMDWWELVDRGELRIEFVNEPALRELMEGIEEWQPRQPHQS